MDSYPHLSAVEESQHISSLNPDLTKEVQQILDITVDGIVGKETTSAFTQFKIQNYLSYPEFLGKTTAQSLVVHAERHFVTEQLDNIPTKLLEDAGQKTGKTANLPLVGLVYMNEFIVSGIPLTWGEMTKDFNPRRIPISDDVVRNLIELAKAFGIARSKYGKPVAVTSGYRPAALGIGVRNSQHIPGRAIDACPLNRADLSQWHRIVMATPEFTAVGNAVSKGFVHADIRPSNSSQIRFGY